MDEQEVRQVCSDRHETCTLLFQLVEIYNLVYSVAHVRPRSAACRHVWAISVYLQQPPIRLRLRPGAAGPCRRRASLRILRTNCHAQVLSLCAPGRVPTGSCSPRAFDGHSTAPEIRESRFPNRAQILETRDICVHGVCSMPQAQICRYKFADCTGNLPVLICRTNVPTARATCQIYGFPEC